MVHQLQNKKSLELYSQQPPGAAAQVKDVQLMSVYFE